MMKLKPAALATLVLLSTLAVGAHAQARKTYIVQLKDEPAATYKGGVAGLAATAAAEGTAYRADRSVVQAYTSYLEASQSSVAATVAAAPILHRYSTVFNGFAASLTEAEALSLSTNASVAGLWEDEARSLDTISTSKFLGLSTPGGVWSQAVSGSLVKGENMVVGIVDGGVWPENPAMFDRVDGAGVPVSSGGTLAFGPAPASFLGGCVAGPGITPTVHCNNKLVGIKHFNAGFNASGSVLHWTDFASSGRDSVAGPFGHGSHGSHTSATAAGNDGATAVVNGLALGTASGVAPRARVASYKVCWTFVNAAATDGTGSQNTCYSSDSVAAIDAAVADGVNVINFSISGSQTSVNDPVEQAFLRAARAGVFVAASAGNSGPANQVAHVSPWIATVAASTHDRAFTAAVTLGSGASYTGGSLNSNALAGKAMIRAEDAGIAGASANLNLCFSSPNELDPIKVAGKIVVCTRGTNARTDKGQAVFNAGGAGMVLVNASAGQTVDADAQVVPTVQVNNTDGTAIKAYAATAGATGSMGTFSIGTKPAPLMAGFSSRGPNQGDSNILKPDLTAPGVDVIASGTPDLTEAQRNSVADGSFVPPPAWLPLQGTSMSSPHVAGLALLVKQANPTWTPAMIKSALMTTAYSTLDDGLAGAQNGMLPWAQGAGHVDPNKALAPGLVYNSGADDWTKYQCKVNRGAVSPVSLCTSIGTFAETYELNLPSITVGAVLGTVTVPRTVTNVGTATATYTATASVPGFTTVVTPASLTIAPGASASFTLRLTPTTAVDGVWSFGQLVWTDGSKTVRSPVQARIGKPISGAPTEFTASSASGSRLFAVRTGFAGRMTARSAGMKEVTMSPVATLAPASTSAAQLKTACQAGVDTAAIKVHSFTVPAGALVARFALRNADVGGGAADDNDLLVLHPDGNTTGYSGNDGSNEAVQIVAPVAGTYRACVAAYAGAAAMTHSLSSWIVSPGEGAGLRGMTPSQVYGGGSATVGMAWTGLATGKRFVGAMQLLDGSGVAQSTTVLRVSTDGSVPVMNEPATVASKLAAAAAE